MTVAFAAATLVGCGSHPYVRPLGPYTGSTRQKAAEHRRDAFLTVWRHNVPQEQATAIGACRLLHRQPWVAYTCPLRMRTGRGPCHLPLVVAVKWEGALHRYVASAKRLGLSNC